MKHMLCIVLSLALVFSMSANALAATGGEAYDFSDAQAGDLITFGSYEQDNDFSNGPEPVEWLVLAREEGRILVISLYGLDCLPFNTEWERVSWNYSSLHVWLEMDFFDAAFRPDEQAMILSAIQGNENPGFNPALDRSKWTQVFLLSASQVTQFIPSQALRQCEPTAYARERGCYVNSESGHCWWWLREVGSDYAAYVNADGSVDSYGCPVSTAFLAIRPAMWLNLSAHGSPVAAADAQSGDIVVFGRYEQNGDASDGPEPVEWLVLTREDDRILAVSRYALDSQPYSAGKSSATWESCSLRSWLNGDFLNAAFTEEEREKIPAAAVPADRNPVYRTNPGKDTEDRIFLLSFQELVRYCYSYERRQATPTAYALERGCKADSGWDSCLWWLRSPGEGTGNAVVVAPAGFALPAGHDIRSENHAVRPALWITLG